MSDTDGEPKPRVGSVSLHRRLPPWVSTTDWPRQIRAPEADLLATVTARRSMIGGPVDELDLASLLRHATMLRTRRTDGRFGEWESRSAPSAGGLHAIWLVVLPLVGGPAGLYDATRHRLLVPPAPGEAIRLNRASVLELTGASMGVSIQLVADVARYGACYDDFGSLMWRDAGALLATMALIATGLSLRSVILGRTGRDIVESIRPGPSWTGVGAIHLGSSCPVPETVRTPRASR